MNQASGKDVLLLADYRRQVQQVYAAVRELSDQPEQAWKFWRENRERLLASHPQSALSSEQQAEFTGLDYFPYDPRLRFLVPVEPIIGQAWQQSELEADGVFRLRPFGRVRFEIDGQRAALTLFWIESYGGGIFLPFRDATNGDDTYGGGRYLLDTIKGADLGSQQDRLVLDFNFAYNPSCVYHPRWHCPLAPPENQLEAAVFAGERSYSHSP
jgi:uncharacterized protein (DUF1684 family)